MGLAAVQQWGLALRFAGPNSKADKDIVLAAVQEHPHAWRHANAELQRNKEIFLAVVQQYGSWLRFAAPDLKADEDIVLAALRTEAGALAYADPTLQIDPRMVLTALHHHGCWAGREVPGVRDMVNQFRALASVPGLVPGLLQGSMFLTATEAMQAYAGARLKPVALNVERVERLM